MTDFSMPFPLADGLELRQARPADLDGIGALLADRLDDSDVLDHRLIVTDPDAGWPSCAVVADGDRIVATATLMEEEVRLGDVILPAGQLELVATDSDYQGRGLVRALMRWAHHRSAVRGHVVQVMIGIPYFYRRFGYEYAIDIPPALPVRELPPGSAAGIRPATAADLPAIGALQDAAQRGFDVAMPHSAACWRWLLAHEASDLWVVEREGAVVAVCRTSPPGDDVVVAEAAALDEEAARDLLCGVADRIPGARPRVVHRAGTVTAAAWRDVVGEPSRVRAEQYYVRIPDVAALLDRLRPVLWRRLAASGLDRAGRDIVVSAFAAHYRIPVLDGGLGAVVAGGPMQGVAAVNGAGVAPDHLPALLFGPHGIEGLSRFRADVYAVDDELFTALFPPLTADLLTYYLPY